MKFLSIVLLFLNIAYSGECNKLFHQLSIYLTETQPLHKAIERFNEGIELFKKDLNDPSELVEANEEILQILQKYLEREGISTEMVSTQMTYKGAAIKFSRLDSVLGDNQLLSLKKSLNVKILSFDLIENELGDTAGFFRRADGQVSISLWKFFKQYDPDHLTGTLRHEFSHAQFENARARGVRSIYSNTYHGHDDFKVGVSNYEDYLSAEELYNYVGDPYGVLKSQRWYRDVKDDFRKDLPQIRSKLERIDQFGGQVGEIAQKFIDRIEKLKKEGAYLIKYNIHFEDGKIILKDKDGRILKSFIDNEKKKWVEPLQKLIEDYQDVFDITDDLMKKVNQAKTVGERGKILIENFSGTASSILENSQRAQEMKELYLTLLNEIESEQKKLLNISRNVIPQRDRCLDLLKEIEANDSISWDSSEFVSLRQELRALANMTHERYSGFMGDYSQIEEVVGPVKRLLNRLKGK